MAFMEDWEPTLQRTTSNPTPGTFVDPSTGPVWTGKNPTGKISAITTNPIDEYVARPAGEKEAGPLTTVKTGFVDNPAIKVKIFAKERFPDLNEKERESRYAIINNNIFYKSDDGTYYPERDEAIPLDRLQNFLVDMVPHAPSIVLGGIGEVFGGPVGAGAGSGIGEAIRQGVGKVAYGEQMPLLERGGKIALETGMGFISGVVGKGFGSGADSMAKRSGGKLVKQAGGDIISGPEVTKTLGEAGKRGIDLSAAQATGSGELIQRQRYLQRLPETAKMMREASEKQAEQVQKAINSELDSISPETSGFMASERIKSVSDSVINSMKQERAAATKDLYDKALKGGNPVEISGIVNKIDDELSKTTIGSKYNTILKEVKNLFLSSGKKKVSKTMPAETMHISKMELDIITEDYNVPGQLKNIVKDIKNDLVSAIETSNPSYREGRIKYAEMSKPIDDIEKTVTGSLAKMIGKENKPGQITKVLFSPSASSPEQVIKAKSLLYKKDPEGWNGAVRSYIQDIMESINDRSAQGTASNLSGNMYKKLFGSQKQDAILKAALSKQEYESLKSLGDILHRVSLTSAGQSDTNAFQETGKKIAGEATGIISDVAKTDLTAPFKKVMEWRDAAKISQYKKEIAQAMLDPEVISKLAKLKELKPMTKKWVETSGTVLSLIEGQNIKENVESGMKMDEMFVQHQNSNISTQISATGPDGTKIYSENGIDWKDSQGNVIK